MKTVPARTSSTRSSRSWTRRPHRWTRSSSFPPRPAYADSVKENGSAAYQDVDIEGAKKLLAGATPEVRIMYNKDNPNRVDAFSLIRESATKAGFKIVDGGLGASDWGKALGNGGYDAAIFGWINPGVGVSGVPQIFKHGQRLQLQQVHRPEADKLMDELIVTTDTRQAGRPRRADRQEDLGFRLRPPAVPVRWRGRLQRPHHRREVHAEPDRCLVELLGVGQK